MSEKNTKLLAMTMLTLNAFVWGISWWPLKKMEALGVHPLWATVVMYSMSLCMVLAFFPKAWQGLTKNKNLWYLMLAAGLTNIGFNWAVGIGDVVRVLILFYLMPAWAVVLAWLLLKEKPTIQSLLRLGIGGIGAMIILWPQKGLSWQITQADGLALLGGFSFALTNVLLRQSGPMRSEYRLFAMFCGGIGMAGVVAAWGGYQGWVAGLPAPAFDWLFLSLVLAVVFLIGNLALQYGASHLPSGITSVVMLSEVIFGSASAVILGMAEMDSAKWWGGSLILFAAFLASVQKN